MRFGSPDLDATVKNSKNSKNALFSLVMVSGPTHQILVAMAAAKTTAKRTKIIISISVELRISSI